MSIKIKTLILGDVVTNCYIVFSEETKKAIIIDPAAKPFSVQAALENFQIEPEAILLTHGHFDHIGAATQLRRQYDMKIYAGEREKEVILSSYNNLSELMGGDAFTVSPDEWLEDGQELTLAGFQIKVIATPGHTQGSVCYLVSLGDEQVLFSGDTLFERSHGRYDFPTSSGTALFKSIKEKLLVLPEDLAVYPGHGDATTIGKEKPLYTV